jgi:hypothetical protein
MGAWSKSSNNENITKITRRVGYRGVFKVMERKHPKAVPTVET